MLPSLLRSRQLRIAWLNLLNQSLVNSHLKGIPGLGTLTTRSLSGGNLQGLGWKTNGTLNTEVLGLGALNEILADLLEGLDLARSEGDADLVGFLQKETLSETFAGAKS